MSDGNKGHNSGKAKDAAPNKVEANKKVLAQHAKRIINFATAITNDKSLATAAGKTRATWSALGRELANAREVISSNKLFNGWLKDAGVLDAVPDRNARTDAMWLANLEDAFVADVVPPALHNPRNIRRWYRDETNAMLDAISKDGKVPGGEITETSVPEQFRAFFENMSAEDFDAARNTYNARVPGVKFKDAAISEAVDAIMRKIAGHTHAVALAQALVSALTVQIERGDDAFKAEAEAEAEDDEDEADEDEADEDEADEDGDEDGDEAAA